MPERQFSRERVAEWVESSCRNQGVPARIRDPFVIGQISCLVTGRAATSTLRHRHAAHRDRAEL
jgi:hypothetical protein